jgi:crotonyl-CoA carboxylase/reductase
MNEKKELYEVGEIPPLGHVPKQMYGWLIRKERHGDPTDAMKIEVIDTPKVGENDVLVMVMAAGVNYNGVWASRGVPIWNCLGSRLKSQKMENW